jgi:hypothetical protein
VNDERAAAAVIVGDLDVLRAWQDQPQPAARPVQVVRRSAPDRLDFHALGYGGAEFGSLQPIPESDVRPALRECVYHATLRLPGNSSVGTVDVAIGRVVGIHIAESALTADGRVDVLRLRPIARLGYYDYTSIESVFQMIIPGNDPAVLAGLEGRPFRE